MLGNLNTKRQNEFEKMHNFFAEMHRELENREESLKTQYNELIRAIEKKMMKNLFSLNDKVSEISNIVTSIKKVSLMFSNICEISLGNTNSDVEIVANGYELHMLRKKFKDTEQKNSVNFKELDQEIKKLILPTFKEDSKFLSIQ